jgi:hypothetical protein
MILLNPWLLAGAGLVIIPVILHMLMRAKPKRMLFPALRLIEQRRKMNSQRMRLRHLWLLLLRMLAIAALVCVLARPSVPAADYGFTSWDWLRAGLVLTVAAAAWFGPQWWWNRNKLDRATRLHRQAWLTTGVAILGLLVFALAVLWPYGSRVAASITSPSIKADQSLPVSAVLVFDTSPSLEYQFESRSRLDVAKTIATEHLRTLIGGSRVALADTSADNPIRFQSELASLQTRITGLTTSALSRPWSDTLEAALIAHRQDKERPGNRADSLREVYVFTDLTAGSWPKQDQPRLRELLAEQDDVAVYFINTGIDQPLNTAVTDLKLSDETVAQGGELSIRAFVRWQGPGQQDRTVELYVEDDGGRLVKQGQTDIKLEPGTDAQVDFRLSQLSGKVRQGEVRVATSDPLAFDNARQFTVRVRPPRSVLVVAPDRATSQFLMEALAPAALVDAGKSRYRCTFTTPGKMLDKPLSQYAAVCLVNVPDPTPAGWQALLQYATDGGGVFVALGGKVNHVAYLSPSARDVLPGELKASLSFRPPEFLEIPDVTHPMVKRFADWGTTELTGVEILKYWRVEPLVDASIVARFTDLRTSAALLDRPLGTGRVALWTTGLDRSGWNDLPASGWSFIALCDQIVRHVSRGAEVSWNHTIGDTVSVPLDVEPVPARVLMRTPNLRQLRLEVPPNARTLPVRELTQAGNYRLLGDEPDSPFEAGLTVTIPGLESDLTRITPEQLTERLGKDRYAVATSIEGLQREVRTGRVGKEAFSFLVMLLALVFAGEHFVANRFYDREQ